MVGYSTPPPFIPLSGYNPALCFCEILYFEVNCLLFWSCILGAYSGAFANMHQHPTTLQTMTCVSDPFPSVVPEQSTGVKSVPTGRNRIHEEDFGTAARRLVERADALTVVASPDRNKVFDIRPDVSYDYSEMSRTPPQGIQPVDRSVISYPAGHSNTTAGGNSMPLPPSPPRNITLRPPDYVPLDRVPKAGANESPTNISLNSSSSGSDVTGNSTQGK